MNTINIEDDDKPLRYSDSGNVHMDFHVATNTTIDFIIKNFGQEAMDQIFSRVGKDVYVDIRRHLMEGNAGELLKHWRHFFDRENADYAPLHRLSPREKYCPKSFRPFL